MKGDRHTSKPRKARSTKAFRLRQSISFAEIRRKRLSLPTCEVRPSEHDYDYNELFYMTAKGIYITLVTQLDKLARHNRQGSFRTKDRYYEAVKRFCAYLAAHYHLQKLENISGKHLVSYVLYLQAQSKSASTIKTDLSAIRFFHDKMSHPRYTLPGNEELGVALERRRFGQQDRTWTNPEFGKLIGRAMAGTVAAICALCEDEDSEVSDLARELYYSSLLLQELVEWYQSRRQEQENYEEEYEQYHGFDMTMM